MAFYILHCRNVIHGFKMYINITRENVLQYILRHFSPKNMFTVGRVKSEVATIVIPPPPSPEPNKQKN